MNKYVLDDLKPEAIPLVNPIVALWWADRCRGDRGLMKVRRAVDTARQVYTLPRRRKPTAAQQRSLLCSRQCLTKFSQNS